MEITEKTKAISDFLNRNCLLSSTLRNFHFASPPLPSIMVKPHIGKTVLDNIRNLQVSLVSVSDEFYKTLNDISLENPLLQTLLSLSKRFNSVTQEIRCNHSRSQNSLSVHNFAAILPGDSVAGLVVANGISNFLNIYNTLLVVRLVLTWFPNSPPAIVSPLSTLCDPYLNIFRGIIPPLGGTLDLSPILAFLVLNAFTSTAAALPAELPVNDISSQVFSSTCPHLTATQKKWMRRVCNSSKKSEEAH